MGFYGANGFFPFQSSILYETDPVKIGLRYAIVFFAGIVSSIGVATYSSYTKAIRGPTVVAFALLVIFYGKKNGHGRFQDSENSDLLLSIDGDSNGLQL